ncbi:MAG TPA: tetratricopeptide repeat protein, partial [Anaeromyxobacteraceae bacterium]|nr:tetratricopeptide repeat protein [Anaeromyxobacteraceae bacterium]
RDADNLRARDLLTVALRRLGRTDEATRALAETLRLDPLDAWGRLLAGDPPRDAQLALDLALDLARAGLHREALELLERGDLEGSLGARPLVHYYAAHLADRLGEGARAARHREAAARASPDYCFPARLEEIAILEAAIRSSRGDARAPYYLGNLLYDRGRREEAIALFERAAELDPSYPVVWRNLGIAYFNVRRDPPRALAAYARAVAEGPLDARLVYERDQLWKRTGAAPRERLAELERRLDRVAERDDLTVEFAALLLLAGRAEEALRRLLDRRFQPWEGGEGLVLLQHTRARLALGRAALARGEAVLAHAHFEAALAPPETLGEARHPLGNASDVHYALGLACECARDPEGARVHFTRASEPQGDFVAMSVQAFSEMTYFSALALGRLGRDAEERALLEALERHATRLLGERAEIDYFATSLPAMLLFEDDLDRRQRVSALVMLAQASLGLGRPDRARAHLEEALALDPSHALASDLLSSAR